jgi:nucleotide-binding universal stress UspA family protein
MKILLGVDDSRFSADLVRAVVNQFRPRETEVRVLHVLQMVALSAPPEMAAGYAPELESQEQPAHDLVERIAKELRSAEFTTETAVARGDVRESIIDAAAEWTSDLIVVGSHGKSGLRRFLLGSVAEFVARHAGCSVEIVRTHVNINS